MAPNLRVHTKNQIPNHEHRVPKTMKHKLHYMLTTPNHPSD